MRKYESLGSDNKHLLKLTLGSRQFALHSRVYERLRRLFNVQGQVLLTRGLTFKGQGSRKDGNSRLTLDIIIFDGKQVPIAIVEVRDSPRHWGEGPTRQETRLRSFGVPVFLIWDAADIDELIQALFDLDAGLVLTFPDSEN